jgi:hypothetical protein
MVCESQVFFGHEENNTYCLDFETGTYEATRVSASVISFWPKESLAKARGKGLAVYYEVRVEEMRAKQGGTKVER